MTVHMIQVSKIKQQVKTGIISKIAMNGRHINLRSIFTTQKYSLLGTRLQELDCGTISQVQYYLQHHSRSWT